MVLVPMTVIPVRHSEKGVTSYSNHLLFSLFVGRKRDISPILFDDSKGNIVTAVTVVPWLLKLLSRCVMILHCVQSEEVGRQSLLVEALSVKNRNFSKLSLKCFM